MTADPCSAMPESTFERATDPGFKARAISEYRRVKSWVGDRIDLDSAKILDFGCGEGIAAASFALRHPSARVVGVDVVPVNPARLEKSINGQLGCEPPPNLSFAVINPGDLPVGKGFDLIYAWSVFEHIAEDIMIDVFRDLKGLLAPKGLIFIQVNPLYFSPRGSKLYNYFKSPWHHLILSLESLRDGVLSGEPTDKERREWRQFLDLNRLTAPDIVDRASAAGLKCVRDQYFTTDLVPPPRLTRVYAKEALVTTECLVLFHGGS